VCATAPAPVLAVSPAGADYVLGMPAFMEVQAAAFSLVDHSAAGGYDDMKRRNAERDSRASHARPQHGRFGRCKQL
jgi:hypothetical protein